MNSVSPIKESELHEDHSMSVTSKTDDCVPDFAKSELKLANEYMRVQEAVNHITQGIILFGTNHDVMFCNDRYIEMFDLSREVVKAGCTLLELLEHRKEAGYLKGDVEEYRQHLIAVNRRGKTVSQEIKTTDGRTIHMVNTPLASGGGVATFEDVSEQEQAKALIEHMALHDALTGLPNRTQFQSRLDHALNWNGRDAQVAVLFIDLDNFKNINDTLGHQIGDELLKVVSDRLRACVRDSDTIARLGGDEFVIIQPNGATPAGAAQLAIRIREAVTAPCKISDHQIIIDTSIGIAISPTDGTKPDQLIKNADLALYGAKGSGRGTYRFFEEQMDARMAARHALELDLRKALVNGEFELQFQPLVNIERGDICACEALLRWTHPKRGTINPEDFIPIAEETGLITRIGEWVIRNACMEAAKWSSDVTLAVNISPVQFRCQNLVQIVTHSLAASGLPAERLEIEITEAILLDQTEITLEKLGQLKALGIRIAMDDFGTGYSSLGYLQKFPFDKIKIDGSFIKGLSDQTESTAIVRAVTGLAGSFRMTTTAEGVETREQLDIVKELGCTEMQGFLFSKACSAADLATLFKSHKIRPHTES
ncbi:putative bifunctional diguanylate cyclase/phosphodiesterase [Aurantiacibacter suaedae]|uniref:putative bifunctional diguanylate cyclase/phosphodiesterase n=1 Tax=Aurantiacibacter suaedae TaxID=2545755 RepID=UPI00138754A8|nr:EAL domain-containing protein [Aurantiacibacter suaedae]